VNAERGIDNDVLRTGEIAALSTILYLEQQKKEKLERGVQGVG